MIANPRFRHGADEGKYSEYLTKVTVLVRGVEKGYGRFKDLRLQIPSLVVG
jgi:hypothetical protein